jgi:hypothetical protein
MDTNTLRTWLGLPPGPWPPGDRELLGLGLELISPADVELRALEQMEKLRPHQLIHPDLVTEGMNRLAQALITLTSPATATATGQKPDGGGETLPPVIQPVRPKPRRPRRPAKPHTPTRQEPPTQTAPTGVERNVVFEAEPVAADKVVQPEPGVFRPPALLSGEAIVPDEVPRPAAVAQRHKRVAIPAGRRDGYAALVRLRKLLWGMEQLRPFFADPGERLVTPLRLFEYIRAVRAFRNEVRRERSAGWPASHGRLVLTVVEHPLSLSVFRELVPSQRHAVAADWAMTHKELSGDYAWLRRYLTETKPSQGWLRNVRKSRGWLRGNPEWLLVVVASAAFVAAVIRTALWPSQ